MEEKTNLDPAGEPVKQPFSFSLVGSARDDSPTKRGGPKAQVISTVIKNDDLEELDEDEEGDEMVQEVEPPVDDSDMMNDPVAPISNQYQLWTMDWGDLDQERRSFRKRPAAEDLPEDVREELASMSGADVEIKPKQKPKLEPPDTLKESSRGRKSPAEEDGVSDISSILTKPARTAEERLAVLEARDKLIRIRSNHQLCTQLKNVGKCPDMCPEKERYERIARHQVDNYEYNRETKEVNLASMVKIYARSSADQQMPLPHDLRPVNVLWMTMSYLVNQFMDLADSPGENLGDWYHFLWDRMRSIRKDITQLALCDTESVQILEMCARFHIFCMERLREEKMAVFDEKINRENLTKCLQSLQYMYNDLFLKEISCPNEPEFQAYSILLHINSDLCTSTILILRSEMRQHKKVQFAINAFLAVTMKNYVRFFKLVKSTTYLNACILHQYFAQVRAHAMHSIIRAYSRQKMRNMYPLSELQAQLLFDSIDDVLEFCRFSKVPVEESNIVLEKKTSHPIPMQEKMKRSFAGVECKRQSSIKEIVTGGCSLADTATLHKVHDSFDEQGILKQEAWYADDQETSSLAVEVQVTRSSSKVDFHSESSNSVHISPMDGTSPRQELVGSVSSSQFSAQTKELQVQNSGVKSPQIPFFGVSNSPSTTQNVVQTNVLSLTSGDISMISGSSAKAQEQQKASSSSVFAQTVSSKSSHAGDPPSAGAECFVFRLPNAKSETKNRKGQREGRGGTQSGFALRTLQSVFGGSGTPMIRSSRPSVLRIALTGHDVKPSKQAQSSSSEYWASSTQEMPAHTVSTQSSDYIPSKMNLSTSIVPLSSQEKSSEFSFKNSALPSVTEADSTETIPGFFVPKSGNSWGSNTTKSLFESAQSFPCAVTSVNCLTTQSSSAVNQFPTSVYGFPTPLSSTVSDVRSKNVSLIPGVDTQPHLTHVSPDLSPSLEHTQKVANGSHSSPLHVPSRAVTVPTSIFGFHSRPLTTPQMFPTSSVSSFTINSLQITFSAPAISSVTTGQSNISETDTNDVGFTLPKGNTMPVPISYSSSIPSTPIVTTAEQEISHFPFPSKEPYHDEKSKILQESSNHDDFIWTEMEVDSIDSLENREQQAFKEAQFKTISPMGTLVSTSETSLTSPNKQKEFSFSTAKISPKKIGKDEIQMMNEIFHKWKLFTYRSKLKRRLQSQEKCAPVGTNLSLEEQANEFPIPQGCIALDFQTRLEYLLDAEEIKVPQSIFPDVGIIKLEKILCSTLPQVLFEKGRLEENMFWKLGISLPGESEGKKFSLQLCDWINATFSDENNKPEKTVLRTARTLIGEEYNLFTSVQQAVGDPKQIMKGVDGLLFFTPRNLSSGESVLERYQKLIQSASSHFPLPIVAIASTTEWVEVCHTWFMSDVQRKTIAAFKIIGPFRGGKESVLEELIGSISWLAQQINPALPFEKWALREVLLTIMSDLWTRVRFTLNSRCSSGFQQHPNDLLGLYHDALKQLQSMIVNDQLGKYSVIAPELEDLAKLTLGDKFNEILLKDSEYIDKIREGFLQLQLNICISHTASLSVESFCEAVCSYNPRLQSLVSHFLCSWEKSDDIDWICIVEALTEIHIRDTIGKLKLKKLIVVLKKYEIQKFRTEPWYTLWLRDRIPYHRHDEEPSDNVSCGDTFDQDLPVSEENAPKLDNSDEKFLSDFETMLNELENLNKLELNLQPNSNLRDFFPPSKSETGKDQSIELDILESQLEYYTNFLKE